MLVLEKRPHKCAHADVPPSSPHTTAIMGLSSGECAWPMENPCVTNVHIGCARTFCGCLEQKVVVPTPLCSCNSRLVFFAPRACQVLNLHFSCHEVASTIEFVMDINHSGKNCLVLRQDLYTMCTTNHVIAPYIEPDVLHVC